MPVPSVRLLLSEVLGVSWLVRERMSEHEIEGLVHDDAAGKRALHGSWNHKGGEHLINGSEDSRFLSQNVKKGLPSSSCMPKEVRA